MKSVFLALSFMGTLVFFTYFSLLGNNFHMKSSMIPFRVSYLKNILEMDVRNGSIFFLETSFRAFEHEVIQANKRAACALESAALHHRNRQVFMVYFFPNVTDDIAISDRFLKRLLDYPNVNLVYAVISDFVANTPVEDLYKKDIIDTSPYRLNHHSDVLRAVTLFKYGGVYMDTDVVVIKSLDPLGGYFIGLESATLLGNGVIGLEKSAFAHGFLYELLRDLSENYNPNVWAANGPLLFTKWVARLCNAADLTAFSDKKCSLLRILSPSYFYAVYYLEWNKLFEQEYNEEVFEKTRNSYLVHFWNKLSSKDTVSIDSDAPYVVLARENCPKVYSKLYRAL